MTMAILPAAPERELKAGPAARGQDRAAASDAFGFHVERAGKDAAKPVDARRDEAEAAPSLPDGPPADTGEPPMRQTAPAESAAADRTSGTLAREVLDLLAAAKGSAEERGAARSEGQEAAAGAATAGTSVAGVAQSIVSAVSSLVARADASAKPRDEAGAELAGPARGAAPDAVDPEPLRRLPLGESAAPSRVETADLADPLRSPREPEPEPRSAEARGRARLEIVRQETHFEPTMRDAVLVRKDVASDQQQSRPATRERDLRLILADRDGETTPLAAPGAEAGSVAEAQERTERPLAGGIVSRAAPVREAAAPEPALPSGIAAIAEMTETAAPAAPVARAVLPGEQRAEARLAAPVLPEPVPTANAAEAPRPDPRSETRPTVAAKGDERAPTIPAIPAVAPRAASSRTAPAVDPAGTGVMSITEPAPAPQSRSATPPQAAIVPSNAARPEGEAGRGRGERGAERVAVPRLFDAVPASQPATVSPAAASPALPVASQVAARIVDAFAGPLPADRLLGASTPEAHLRLRAGGAALKTLTIQLQPEHLGTLHISMRLNEGRLTLEMAASRAETARILAEDRSSLRTLLESAGFSLEDAAITIVAREAPSAQPAATGSRDQDGTASRGFERQADQGMAGGGRDGRSSGEGKRGTEAGGPAAGRAETPPAGAGRGGSVFL